MGRRAGIPNPFDARSTRGILSRGHARYGVSKSPKPGNILDVQKAAQARVKKMQKLNDNRITR
jgi:hypothetical protein